MSPKAITGLIEYEPVSERIVRARIKGRTNNLTILSVYAPIRDATEQQKDQFFSDLQTVIDKIPRKDILLIGGDFNARIGGKLNNSEHAIGKHGLGDRCTNGNRLLLFAMQNNLAVANTWFRHKPCHTYTWESRDGRVKAQIDYLLVSRRWKSMVLDSRVHRGADTGSKNGSDHFLLKTRLKYRLSSRKTTMPNQKIDVSKLKVDEYRGAFVLELSNRFVVLQDDTEEATPTDQCPNCPKIKIEKKWSKLKDHINEAASNILGFVKRKTKKWISEKTLKLCQEKRNDQQEIPHIQSATTRMSQIGKS